MSSSLIASHVPGRLRLRAPTLRGQAANLAAQAEAASWDGVLSVEGSPTAASLLIHYDATRMTPGQAAGLAVRLVPTEPEPAPGPPPPATPSAFDERLWRLNRPAKLGMLASLAGSLAALTVGKKAHAALGVLHLAFLTIHLANHRKKLTK